MFHTDAMNIMYEEKTTQRDFLRELANDLATSTSYTGGSANIVDDTHAKIVGKINELNKEINAMDSLLGLKLVLARILQELA